MNFDGNSSDDTSDEDYIPSKDEDAVNEISEDDVESDASANREGIDENGHKRKLKKQIKCQRRAKKTKDGTLEDDCNELKEKSDAECVANDPADNDEKEKEHANQLWDDFLKDSKKTLKKPEPVANSATNSSYQPSQNSKDVVTKEYNFAGEVVRVSGEVDSGSKGLSTKVGSESDRIEVVNKVNDSKLTTKSTVTKPGGLNSVLNKISGLKKMSTLEKSRLDWNIFKEDEGISEDLKLFNKGRNGFLEKQAFLQRTDEKQFALEKQFRNSKR